MATSVSSPPHVHHRPHSWPHAHRGAADPCVGEVHAGKAAPVTELPAAPAAATAPEPARTSASEGMIRVYDQFGRAVTIGREAWRRDVLLPNLQANRNNPDALYDLVVSALNDGFATDVLDSARHLDATRPAAAARRHGARDRAAAAQGSRGGARRAGTRHRQAWRESLSIGEPRPRLCGGRRRCPCPGTHLARARARTERGDRAQLDDRHGASPGAGRRAGRIHARSGAAGKLARTAVARAICTRSRRSCRGDAAVRGGARRAPPRRPRTCSCS